MESRVYRLAPTTQVLFGVAVLLLLAVILLGFDGFTREGGFATAFFFIWIAFAICSAAYAARRAVISITLEDGVVTFRSLVRTIRVPVSAIIAVETSPLDMSRYNPYFTYAGGRIMLLGPLDDFYDLLMRLKQLNPSLRITRL